VVVLKPLFPLLAVSLFALALLAGCVGGDGGGKKDVALDDAGPPKYDSEVEAKGEGVLDTGTIQGKVVDEFGAAIEGALVTVAPANGTLKGVEIPPASSNADGAVSFAKVPVGAYSVTGNAEGFDARNTAVSVRKGETASFELKLPPLVVDDGFNVTVVFQGRITCWVRIFLPGNVCGVTDGSTVNQALGSAGKSWANNHAFAAGLAAAPPVEARIVTVMVEVEWEETRAAGQSVWPTPFGLTLVLSDANATGSSNRNSTGANQPDDTPPPRVAFPKNDLDAWGLTRGGNFTFYAYPSSVAFNDVGFDIAYTAHATVFYNRVPHP
jgi:hypothetical protein